MPGAPVGVVVAWLMGVCVVLGEVSMAVSLPSGAGPEANAGRDKQPEQALDEEEQERGRPGALEPLHYCDTVSSAGRALSSGAENPGVHARAQAPRGG